MVKKRHIAEVAFAAPTGTPTGVEVMSLADLRSRAPAGVLQVPARPEFHQLLTVTSGALVHDVDLTGYALAPGSWLWVRPGQVQQWGDVGNAEGELILFERGFLDPDTVALARLDDPFGPVMVTPGGADERKALSTAVDHLTREFRADLRRPIDIHISVLRHLLACLVLNLAHAARPTSSPAFQPSEAYLRFRDAVERDFRHSRCLDDYAHPVARDPRRCRGQRKRVHRPAGRPGGQALARPQPMAGRSYSHGARVLQRHELQQVLPQAHRCRPNRVPFHHSQPDLNRGDAGPMVEVPVARATRLDMVISPEPNGRECSGRPPGSR